MRMPPTAGPSAAPVAPAVAQIAVARRSEPTVAGSSSSDRGHRGGAAERLHAAGRDQGPELVGERRRRGRRRRRSPARPRPPARARPGAPACAAGTAASAITRLKETSTQVTPATLVSSSR